MASPVVQEEDFAPTEWKHVPSKPNGHVSSPADKKLGAQLAFLRGEVTELLRVEKDCDFDLGRLFKQCRDQYARGRTGIYMKFLKEVKTSWKKADRLIKFYERELRVIVAKRNHNVKWAAQLKAWGIEDADALDRKANSQAKDDVVAMRKILNERERQRIEEVKAQQKKQAKDSVEKRKLTKAEETAPELVGRIEIEWDLTTEEFEIFKQAWMELGNEKGSIIIFKAVTDAAAKIQR